MFTTLYPLETLKTPPYANFLAIPLPEKSREKYRLLIDQLTTLNIPVNYQKTGSPHITLNYFGNLSFEQIEKISTVARAVCSKIKPFPVSIGHCGHFGTLHKPRVLWQEVNSQNRIEELQQRLKQKLPAELIENRLYQAHFTVVRIKNAAEYLKKEAAIQAILNETHFTFTADRIVYYGAIGQEHQIPLREFPFKTI